MGVCHSKKKKNHQEPFTLTEISYSVPASLPQINLPSYDQANLPSFDQAQPCIGCCEIIRSGEKRILCDQFHAIGIKCGCAVQFFDVHIERAGPSIKCPSCSGRISVNLMERIMTLYESEAFEEQNDLNNIDIKIIPESGPITLTPMISCSICQDQIKESFYCKEQHYFGIDCGCARKFLTTVFQNPNSEFPIKCPICKNQISLSLIEKSLASLPELLANFRQFMILQTLKPGPEEIVMTCPFCNYFEVRNKNGSMFVFCQDQNCGKRSCYFCHQECPLVEGFEDENSDTYKHFMNCFSLAEGVAELEKAVEIGMKIGCPKCGLSGVKDDNCTHITCAGCSCIYCYFCGQDDVNCNKSSSQTTIYGHNVDWQRNPFRCPMYLQEISQIDKTWANNARESLQKFTKIRIIKKVQETIAKLGSQKFEFIEQRTGFLKKNDITRQELAKAGEDFFKRIT